MDPRTLREFLFALPEWPSGPASMHAAADGLRRFLAVPLAGLTEGTAAPTLVGDETAESDEGLKAFVTAALARVSDDLSPGADPGADRVRRLPLQSGRDPLAAGRLLLAPLRAAWRDPAEDTSESEGGGRPEAWLIVASRAERTEAARAEAELAVVATWFAVLLGRRHLERALRQRDQFLSIASHELKTPLTSIYGILQLQERMLRPRGERASPADQERQHSFFRIVIRQVERLNELIDGLLDVSRICNRRFSVEPVETDVAAITAETASSRLSVIGLEAGVRIETEVPPQLVAAVDPVRFEEVVTNLGMNAIRFSPEGGTVTITLRPEADGFTLSVRDQGPAVPEADRLRIFRPFERAPRTARLGGLGLGLFISRQIAQLHGGDVTLAESRPGKGNRFEARFPGSVARVRSA